MSPRRSSRARSSAQPPPPPSQTASSNSSSAVKNPRAAQRSESIDDPIPDDDGTQSQANASEPIMPRRSRRNGIEEAKPNTDHKQEDETNRDVDGFDEPEEEITRCICGQAEYPGPTPHAKDLAKGAEFLEALGDDLGNFFVQCDKCAVWQHGGCMGLIDEANLPDQYFCEQCKPDLHRPIRGSNGTRSSRYLPVMQAVTSRDSSLSSGDKRKKEGKNKQHEPAKRRATLNSRVAYDEDEMLRRAIEESKMGTLGKRAREDADDSKPAVKRQRTGSSSSEAASKRSVSPATVEEIPTRAGAKAKQNLRGAVAKNNREQETREKQKEHIALTKAEAANRRNARSERRRGEDSPPPTPSLSPSKHLSTLTNGRSNGDTPGPTSAPVSKSKARARTAPLRRGRLGRNQYTRDRDLNGADSDTPMRDTSHERNGNGDSPNGRNHDKINGESGRSSKAKTHPARTSMNEMKRRVAAILEFVGQLQTQRNNASGGSSGKGNSNSGGGTPDANGIPANAAELAVAGLVKAVQAAQEETENVIANGEGSSSEDGAEQRIARLNLREDGDFRTMASQEMMETLTRELVGWQRVYGVYSR